MRDIASEIAEAPALEPGDTFYYVPFLPPHPIYLRWGTEAADVERTMDALKPHLKAGVSHYKLGSVCGMHAEDARRFIENRASLTPAARRRLQEWASGVGT